MLVISCFEGQFLELRPCTSDAECGPQFSCNNGCCGGTMWCSDQDGDTYGDAGMCACGAKTGPGSGFESWVANGDDCDDEDPSTFPGAAENEDPVACLTDKDGDGWSLSDCDDNDDKTYLGAAENEDPAACMTDTDADGWGASDPRPGITPGEDCDDDDASLFDCASCNLLTNGAAELGLEGWNQDHGKLLSERDVGDDDDPSAILFPHTGERFFVVGGENIENNSPPCEIVRGGALCEVYQDVMFPSELLEAITSEDRVVTFQLRAYLQSWVVGELADTPELSFRFLSPKPGEAMTAAALHHEWTLTKIQALAPATSSGIRVTLRGKLTGLTGKYMEAFFDDIVLFDTACPGSASAG